jgi:UDPglucose--hexose-1-phosphate uridylyltransferase
MTELRQDPTTRNWVILAPERGQRPHDRRASERSSDSSGCPFCPGHETETPAESDRIGTESSWRVRTIPNKFAALAPDGSTRRRVIAHDFVAMDGVGHHEVVVESPEHFFDLATARDDAVEDVFRMYRRRYLALRREGPAVIVIFRNHGVGAGTSLAHPHSQIVAAPVVPPLIRQRFDVAMQHFDDLGTCLYLDILERERVDGRRMLLEEPSFAAFQPFASSVPFETWIVPRVQQASFGAVDDEQLRELAHVLRRTLAALRVSLDDPDYNYVIHSAPPDDEQQEYFIWHLQIVPRLSTPAGFELGSGIAINLSLPEETAASMRDALKAT